MLGVMLSGGTEHPNETHPDGLAAEVGKRDAFEHPEVELYLNLIRAAEQLSEQFDALFKRFGLSQTQYNAMRIMRGHGAPIPSGLVARQMVTREPDITRLLERLVKLGLVKRKRSDQDRRIMLAGLTEEGSALLAELDQPVLDLHQRQLAHLGDAQLQAAIDLLERVRDVPDRA